MPGGHFGELRLSTLSAWAAWEARFGIVTRPPDVSKTFAQLSGSAGNY
jgi:hypothetical protein